MVAGAVGAGRPVPSAVEVLRAAMRGGWFGDTTVGDHLPQVLADALGVSLVLVFEDGSVRRLGPWPSGVGIVYIRRVGPNSYVVADPPASSQFGSGQFWGVGSSGYSGGVGVVGGVDGGRVLVGLILVRMCLAGRGSGMRLLVRRCGLMWGSSRWRCMLMGTAGWCGGEMSRSWLRRR